MTSGARVLWQTLQAQGVEVCFANPGTTELDLVRAVEGPGALRCVLGLQENVCTGAADGYGRMRGQPAATLLHLGPGFANGIANLHNARRARTPIVNVIGDHTSWHLPYDAPLTSDIESLARPVSGWVHRIRGPEDVMPAALEAFEQSHAQGGQSATLIFPADFQAQHAASPAAVARAAPPPSTPVASADLQAFATRLSQARAPLFLLGGGGERSALSARGQRAVARLLGVAGGSAYAETFPARAERGRGLPAFDRLPYFPEPARAVLDAADLVVLVGAPEPITYFGYEGHPSALVPTERQWVLCLPGADAVSPLEQLADLLKAPPYVPTAPPPEAPMESGALTPARIGQVLARTMPEGAIVSVEGGTCGYPFYAASPDAAAHTALTNTGGAIGQGLPVALGAAIACPGRPVVALLSDGSTQYTIQTLWTLAHEKLPVVILIAANHQYGILRNELRRGQAQIGENALRLTSLDHPRIDWVGLSQAYGVSACRVEDVQALQAALQDGFSRSGPMLIEMTL